MRSCLFIVLLLNSVTLFAQTGNYFLSHYVPRNERFDNVCFDIAQDERGVLYFATKSGVIQFDGRNWDRIQGNSAIYTIEILGSEIFWGGAGGFGRIEYKENNKLAINTLSQATVKDVYQSLIVNDNVYFLNDDAVYISQKNDTIVSIHSSDLTGSFTNLFELYGVPFVGTDRSGIFKIDNGKLVHYPLELPESSEVIFCTRFEDKYLLGTSDNRTFRCSKDLHFEEIVLEAEQYARAGVIITGSWVNNDLVALGTLRGGVIFVNPYNGRTVEIINYNTGLPDNEIFALKNDKNQNIWVAHDYGFTRIAPYLPFRSFSHYPGLQGNLLCARSFQGSVYVGTSLGLFKLVKEDLYEDIVYYVDVEVPVKPKPVQKSTPIADTQTQLQVEQEPIQEPEKKRKGFLRFLKRNRDKKEEPQPLVKEEDKKENAVANTPEPVDRSVIRKEKRTEKILLSSKFVYKKIAGIETKVTNLIEFKGKLLAAGLGGIFEISDLESNPILEQPIRVIYGSDTRSLVIASTYGDEMKTLQLRDNTWIQTNTLAKLEDQINFIFEGVGNELWLCGLDRIYRLEVDEESIKNIHTTEVVNPNFDEIVGLRWKDHIVMVNKEGFFRYDSANVSFTRIDSLPKPQVYFASGDNLWFRDDHDWNFAVKSRESRNLQMLNLFTDVRFIAADTISDNLWIITGNNELYKFFGEALVTEVSFPLFLKSVTHGDHVLSGKKRLSIDEQSPITFEVVLPGYIGAEAIEYRYFLKGIDNPWSEWAANNDRIDFPYLPPGDYTLSVQARDVFGKINEMEPVHFQVKTLYWRTSWFYAMEFAVFSLLVLLSFKLSVKYRIVSRLLMLLSIILLIEFIQTIAGSTFSTNTSPIIDFLIQVLIAFIILPIEGYLRNLMFRSIDSTSKMYRIASEENFEEKPADQLKE